MPAPLERLQLYLCLMPVAGVVPAAWTLARGQGSAEQRRVSRLAITTALVWLLAYGLLGTGAAQTSGIWHFRLLLLDTFVTSGYFLTCLVLMARVWQRQPARLPGVGRLAERVLRKRSRRR
ncbi:MAG: hypothetical protein HC838_13195 [Spirulinaceae cyanobacterium RM2_2_10]|nr:hypothetical protein [Spirulinaceae cyanobacterium SM2_1_0]NJO20800.1 hypothetical protein [Spirulinaceae cyanobacterium RM2_2_10]